MDLTFLLDVWNIPVYDTQDFDSTGASLLEKTINKMCLDSVLPAHVFTHKEQLSCNDLSPFGFGDGFLRYRNMSDNLCIVLYL